MKPKTFKYLSLPTLLLILFIPNTQAKSNKLGQMINVSLQKRIPSELDEGAFIIVNEIQEWNGNETAIIICDMWDEHWCKGATRRVAEMAGPLNDVVSIARDKGVQIVHAPSDCMDYYKNHPARKLAKKYKHKNVEAKLGKGKLACELDDDWPFKLIDEGCDDNPDCQVRKAWTKQIDSIEIVEGDIITDSGVEAGSFFFNRGVKNVILVGVHTNMCF